MRLSRADSPRLAERPRRRSQLPDGRQPVMSCDTRDHKASVMFIRCGDILLRDGRRLIPLGIRMKLCSPGRSGGAPAYN